MKRIVPVFALLWSLGAQALEVSGVRLADTVEVGSARLQLNGAGTRTKFILDVYVAALYLVKKMRNVDEILADAGPKRVALHMLRSMRASTLQEAFREAIAANHSAAEFERLDALLGKFYAVFATLPGVREGDVILLDYLPGTGTRIVVNGVEKGIVEGAEANRAVLKIWLGSEPVQQSLKKAMLGG